MKNLISFERAVQLSVALFSLFTLFHLAIIIGIVIFDYAPVDFLWGGRMETSDELLKFEIISLLTITFCLLIVAIRSRKISASPLVLKISRILLWILVALFLLNTVGNILAKTTFEKGFGVVTILMAFACLRLALEPLEGSVEA